MEISPGDSLEKADQCKIWAEGQWCTNRVSSTYEVSVWRLIRSLWPTFATHISFKVGNGTKISLHNDDRIGNIPLKEVFPDIV